VEYPTNILDCLRPRRRLNEEVINSYVRLVRDASEDSIIMFSSSFMTRLAGGHSSIEKEWSNVSPKILVSIY
jgi:Ulp1 family protease